jgi:hypothetical protein
MPGFPQSEGDLPMNLDNGFFFDLFGGFNFLGFLDLFKGLS